MDISIARAEELPDLYANVHESWPHAPDLQEHTQLRLASLQHRHAVWYRIKIGSKIASSLGVYPFKLRMGSEAYKLGMIGAVHTSPEFRGQSLAPQLIEYVHADLKRLGYSYSGLYSDIKPSYYKRLGYVQQSIFHAVVSLELLRSRFSLHELEKLKSDEEILKKLMPIYREQSNQAAGLIEREASHWKWNLARNPDAAVYLVRKENRDWGYLIVGSYESRPCVIDWVLDENYTADQMASVLVSLAKLNDQQAEIDLWVPSNESHPAFKLSMAEHSVPMIRALGSVPVMHSSVDIWQPIDHV